MRRRIIVIVCLLLALSLALAACGGGGAPAATSTPTGPVGDASRGAEKFASTCVACHGPDATGVTGLGKDLTTSEYVKGRSDADLLAFVKTGRSASDPANTTGVDMPPKGGNPALTDQDLADIIAYVRTLQK
jgi:disulfide bond formation protein DsbB